MNDTIVAIATPNINSAISIIRVSGPESFNIINKLAKKQITKKGYRFCKEYIYDGDDIVDEVIILKFVAPRSFTGDDLIEINCHGGILVTNKVFNLILDAGARLAENGEFTKRAFLNNKISLRQANSINNLVFAKTETTVNLASKGIVNSNSGFFNDIKERLFYLIGKIEVNIDYPEYDDIEEVTFESYKNELEDIIFKLSDTVKKFKNINYLYQGLNVAIIGKPNVGKSSLLNSLLNKDKAIVSNIKGTTRDVISESVNIDGLLLNFIDTAGIRSSKNEIENLGIKKTFETIKEADLILFVIDNSKKISKKEREIFSSIKAKKIILVKNKSDLNIDANSDLNGIKISALNKDINNLVNEIKTVFKQSDFDVAQNLSICSENEMIFVNEILKILKKTYMDSQKKIPLDLLAVDLTLVYKKICTFLGLTKDLDIIDKMFKNFCLGK